MAEPWNKLPDYALGTRRTTLGAASPRSIVNAQRV